jgi:uncharacterized iron-regulated membrane protein
VTFLDRPQTVFLRRALFQVHLWIGIVAGLYVLLISVTGAALVFRIEMQRAMHPRLFTPSSGGSTAHPVEIMNSVARAFPGERVSGVDAPTTARPTYLAYASRGNRFRTLLLDPVTANLLGELADTTFLRTLQDLHFDLLGGRTGRIVNGVGALFLAAMCLTGLVIWWPGRTNWRRGLTIDLHRRWRRVNWDLHSAVGVWTVALVAMWAITGAYFAFPSAFRSAVNAISPLTVSRAPLSAARSGRDALSWHTLIEEARRHAPGQHVARVVVPASETAALLVMFSDLQPTPAGAELLPVYLDQYSGAVLTSATPAPRTIGDVIIGWVAPLHVGSFGGTAVRIAWLVVGLSPAFLFVTGFTMWWTRVVRPRWLRVSQPATEAIR